MNKISQIAFFDELDKIAEEMRSDDKFITKDRLKRLAQVMGATALGTGLGAGTGALLYRTLKNSKLIDNPSVLKYGPAVLGGAAGLGAMLTKLHRDATDRYVHSGKI